MYIDQNEIVRVRVEADEFCDDEPGPPKATEGVQVRREAGRAPFSMTVSSFRARHILLVNWKIVVLDGRARARSDTLVEISRSRGSRGRGRRRNYGRRVIMIFLIRYFGSRVIIFNKSPLFRTLAITFAARVASRMSQITLDFRKCSRRKNLSADAGEANVAAVVASTSSKTVVRGAT